MSLLLTTTLTVLKIVLTVRGCKELQDHLLQCEDVCNHVTGQEFPSLVGLKFWEGNVFCCCILSSLPPPRHTLCAECTRSLATCDILSNCLPSRDQCRPPAPLFLPLCGGSTFHKGGKIAAFPLSHPPLRSPARPSDMWPLSHSSTAAAAAYLSEGEQSEVYVSVRPLRPDLPRSLAHSSRPICAISI